MAQDPRKPRNSGKVELPNITAGMNKKRPDITKPKEKTKGSIMLGTDDPEPPKKRKRGKVKREPRESAKAGDDLVLDAAGEEDADEASDTADDETEDKDEHGPPPKKESEEILTKGLKRFTYCVSQEADNRSAMLQDIKFKRGRPEDQWPSDVLANRLVQRRPAITVSKIWTFVHQVTNDLRQNRPSIGFSPVGDKADKDAAKIFKGLVRAIERDSHADIARDTASDSSVTAGLGWIRVATDWDDEDSFDQIIQEKRVRNIFSVYADPDHVEPDGADMRYAFITEMIPRSEFEDQFPDADPMNFDRAGIGDQYKDWIEKDNVRIAEYFEITHEVKRLVQLENGHTGYYDDLDDAVKDEIKKFPNTIVDEREAECPKVMWYKMSAVEILDKREWPGRWIPLVKVIGDEVDVEGKVEYQGVVRHIKGAQQMRNYWRTKQTEAIALAPNSPWIAEEGQMEGHEDEWKQQNTLPTAVLTYKGTSVSGHPAPPPQRTPFAEIPAGFVNAVEGADQDMQGASGIRFDATKNERLNDESGIAIKELRRSTDIGALHYGDNLGRSLKHLGKIYLDLIPKILTRKQVVTILGDDDKESKVTIDPNAAKSYQEQPGKDGKVERIFNPKIGKYGIAVTLGSSYATQRMENADRLLELTKAMPNVMSMAADLIVKSYDFEDSDELARRLAAALPPGVLQPDMKDVPPQVQAMVQQLKMQLQKLGEEHKKALAALESKDKDRGVAQDKIDKDFEAKILKIQADAEEKFQTRVHELVSGAIDKIAQRQMTTEGADREDQRTAFQASQSAANGKQK